MVRAIKGGGGGGKGKDAHSHGCCILVIIYRFQGCFVFRVIFEEGC